MKYYYVGIQYIARLAHYLSKEERRMNSEIRELNRIVCSQCVEKEYEKCRSCRIYLLINSIASS